MLTQNSPQAPHVNMQVQRSSSSLTLQNFEASPSLQCGPETQILDRLWKLPLTTKWASFGKLGCSGTMRCKSLYTPMLQACLIAFHLQNCSVPKGMSGTEVASKIGDAFCEFGQVVLFKVGIFTRSFGKNI